MLDSTDRLFAKTKSQQTRGECHDNKARLDACAVLALRGRKTSIARALLKRDPGITMSVSATTRQRRPGETEGKDYFFVDEQQFKTDMNKGRFGICSGL